MSNHHVIMNVFRLVCFVIICSSCAQTKAVNRLKQRGFTADKDTVYISQDEYVYVANKRIRYGKSKSIDSNFLNVKLDIKGFENSDTIPVSIFLLPFQFTIGDTSIHDISEGRMDLLFEKITGYIYLNSGKFNTDISNFKKNAKNFYRYSPMAIIIWGIKIKKNNTIYAIPSRHYFLTKNSR